jgi:Flp pilus assembly protein TadG
MHICRKPSRILLQLRKLRNDRGNSVIEVALIMSLFGAPLILGSSQAAILIYDSIEVSNAAHAAAMYGMQGLSYASDNTQMIAVAQAEASDLGTSLTVTPTTYYACSTAVGGTQYTGTNAQSNATSACSGGNNHPLQFVQVITQEAVTAGIRFPGLPASVTLTGSSVMEIEE